METAITEGPAKYGDYYWCIKSGLSDNGDIYVHANTIEVTTNGDLLCWGKERPDGRHIMLALAAGKWSAFYAASCIDGSAQAVQHWAGEVVRE